MVPCFSCQTPGRRSPFQRMDGAMLASTKIAEQQARAGSLFRRPTKFSEDAINLMHLNYVFALLCARV